MTKEQIEAERVRFEKWFIGGDKGKLHRDPSGNYIYATAHNYWFVWLAAKQDAAGNKNGEVE